MSESSSQKFHAGQLLCGGFQGTNVTAQAYHLIVQHHVSAMILSKKNAVSVKQMTKLIRDLQYIAYTQANYKYPLLFAIDEEGGMMNSLFDPNFLSQFPGAMAMAATGDADLVYKILKAIAIELKHIGFLIILGPVLDVVTKLSHQLVGVRSFGTTVEDVTKYGKSCARGLKDGGLITVGKHFPGIGNASVDSLLELPMMADSLDQIKHFNSVPFAELIKDKLLDGISAAGCGVPTISPDETHACLSPIVINQLLRQDLGFDGMVISECLEMDALYHSIGLGQGVILALYAGCDLVMVCHDKTLQDEAVESIDKALANGNLDDEIISACLRRIEKLQRKLPSWNELFPRGEDSAKEDELPLFKDRYQEIWKQHQALSQMAYRKSITLVRDYTGTLPITKIFESLPQPSNAEDNTNNILLLTPLLNPIYPRSHGENGEPQLYTGEEVFQKFGDFLSNHYKNLNSKNPYNVLHTTYTANGLTALHESLIENSKAVIVLTSEASRNMYQIGIVKYISILCGANPSSFNNTASSHSQLAKPLIIVASLSPYDFFYNKSIGSAYLCCYDYTNNVLKELAGVLMGDIQAEGCIPGEKKFVGKLRKRKSIDSQNTGEKHNQVKERRSSQPKRRWLVDEFDLKRDWAGLINIWKSNTDTNSNVDDLTVNVSNNQSGEITYQDESFYKKMYQLLSTTANTQKHFVIRNSSLNILYGFVLTWVDDSQGVPLDGDLTKLDNIQKKTGSIMYLLVDKSKRLQSIGKNLHARAIRYLTKEQKCTSLTLGCSFPLLVLPKNSNLLTNNKVVSFMNNVGWDVSNNYSKKKHIMVLYDLNNWLVPKKIFRELTIVGVRFDVCTDPQKLMNLIHSSILQHDKLVKNAIRLGTRMREDKDNTKELYIEAIKYLTNSPSYGVKIIIALEPTNQNVIGSIILFTNKSQMSKFYPFLEECLKDSKTLENLNLQDPLIGGIMAPVIDPSYSNLTEIINFGLICSAITFAKSGFNDNDQNQMNKCVMVGISDDNLGNISGIKEIGFEEWKYFYDFYDAKNDVEKSFLGE
ncbi:MAG: hypothetical protein L0L22_10510 [Staphylococcus equorum]|nr:hypothetical protein [Staphylococcus equorum]